MPTDFSAEVAALTTATTALHDAVGARKLQLDASIADNAAHLVAANPHPQYATGGAQDTHSARVDNPHAVTAQQVGAAPAGHTAATETHGAPTGGRLLHSGDRTTSNLDSAAGRLLAVGDFGLGAALGPNITDFGVDLRPGLYRARLDLATGSPLQANVWALVVVGRTDRGHNFNVYATQTGVNHRVWTGSRTSYAGTVTWREIYTSRSILGVVSQAGGIPTGAVIERGSNANGTFVKFADGTMICSLSVASGAAYKVWTYPATFVDASDIMPFASPWFSSGAKAMRSPVFQAIGVTSLEWGLVNTSDGFTMTSARLMAIGRWF